MYKTLRFIKDVHAGRSTARSPYMKMLRSGRCVGGIEEQVTTGLSPQYDSLPRSLEIIEGNNSDLVPDVFKSLYRNTLCNEVADCLPDSTEEVIFFVQNLHDRFVHKCNFC
jgi:hypothetical protein